MSGETRFDPRKLMEQAIEVMRGSAGSAGISSAGLPPSPSLWRTGMPAPPGGERLGSAGIKPAPPGVSKGEALVGAVLVKPDGRIDTACRGELHDGDHAEFTLLERKNRAARLDG